MDSSSSRLSLEAFIERYGGCLKSDQVSLWVFGYGSLLWKPGCDYNAYKIGHIENFVRKFNQGNETFRGTCEKPARVANIEEQKGAQTWGIAYQFKGQEEVTEALHRLYYREVAGGDYVVIKTKFYPRGPKSPYKNIALPHPPCSTSKTTCETRTSSKNSGPFHETPLWSSLSSMLSTLPTSQYLVFQSSICGSISNFHENIIRECPRNNSTTNSASRYRISAKFGDRTASSVLTTQAVVKETRLSGVKNNMKDISNVVLTNDSNCDQKLSTEFDQEQEHRTTGLIHRQSSLTLVDMRLELTQNSNLFSQNHQYIEDIPDKKSSIDVLVFTVREDNRLYLGPDDLHIMADQIMDAKGIVGSNSEYVLNTSEFIQKYIPEEKDALLFELDSLLRDRIARRDSMVFELGKIGFGSSRIIG